ncbi:MULTISPECIES: putative RNA methyltransferase [unclassified Ruminococcus]|uniref:putative RNA methyltransferase n=1 Tax=unclassified Ruminococcus TaxID=2608920 RepID=UPI002109114D|nr:MULTISPECIES: methyltransferase domain-containing protein [unclassified Ruminococcus]MCQ4022655.1 methyltransferase domain-containing protein [Ruminococcus sp. zg-924]MCQ4114895.1 methyltransferase domain-containing protein [Ruminococcus sp. zg-921]
MLNFSCPVCGNFLYTDGKTYKCEKGHCFDVAKQGYVNLLQSQQSKLKRHGDDKLMVRARYEFLNDGYYAPLMERLCDAVNRYLPDKASIIDAGCGDCCYSSYIAEKLYSKQLDIAGIDISKDAVIFGAKRKSNLRLAIASVFSMPFADLSTDAILNVFSPFAVDEYARILKCGGYLFRVIPLENHLFGLKEKVYDKPYKNPTEEVNIDGFTLVENIEVKYTLELKSIESIDNLFKMTPYYYKTSKQDQAKLNGIQSLKTPVEFSVLIYKKH